MAYPNMIYELLRCPATYTILQPFAIRFFSYENRFLLMFVRVTRAYYSFCKQNRSTLCDTLDHIVIGLHTLVAGTCNYVHLLLLGQVDELNSIS